MADPAAALGLNLNVPSLIGPFIMGCMAASFLCGAVVVQCIHFFVNYGNDRTFHKLAVASLTATSVAAWSIQIYALWWFSITSRSTDLDLLGAPLILYVPIPLVAISQGVSQTYFSYRSYQLCERNKAVGVVFIILILGTFGMTVAAAAVVFSHPKWIFNGSVIAFAKPFLPGIKSAFDLTTTMHEAQMVVAACSDVLITGVIAWRMHRIREGFHDRYGTDMREFHTDRILTQVVIFTVSTAAISTLFEILTAVFIFTTIYHRSDAFFFGYILPHVYALVCIGSLNLRQAVGPNRRPGGSHSAGKIGGRDQLQLNPTGTGKTSEFISTNRTRTELDMLGLNSSVPFDPTHSSSSQASPQTQTPSESKHFPTESGFEYDSYGSPKRIFATQVVEISESRYD